MGLKTFVKYSIEGKDLIEKNGPRRNRTPVNRAGADYTNHYTIDPYNTIPKKHPILSFIF